MKKINSICIFFLPIFLLLFGCAASRKSMNSMQSDIEKSPVFSKAFTGFTLLDPANNQTIFSVNADKYFTPASNAKIFTLYTCLKTIKDSLPALQFQTDGESLYFRGTGDPTFLHPTLGKYSPTFRFLQNRRESRLLFNPNNFDDTRFGAGWMVDDATFPYQTERLPMPIYGNVMTIRGSNLDIYPPRFRLFLNPVSTGSREAFVVREEFGNRLSIHAKADIPAGFEQKIPICWQNLDFNGFLKDTLNRPITTPAWTFFEKLNPRDWQTLRGAPLDTVLRAMMLPSDNFLAEQLLIVCASQLTDTLSGGRAIDIAQRKFLADLPDLPIWVDGSGLSRYNKMTPRSIAFLISKIWAEIPHERALRLFPAGGSEGTIKDFYKPAAGEKTWIFAKTGTMSGVHSLSGFLIARSGKVLVFSFMHNNFIGSSLPYKLEMERILRKIWAKY
jgi:serine-type D-Ala-D-Ala carboxypeptidase/endopeptidase (penicillin-binding protein 4)